jgi:methionine sulfoxide reductase heme-binding subunit
MKTKKICQNLLLVGISLFLFSFSFRVKAQTPLNGETKVDYKGEIVVDSDLDGLTDKGEEQIYHTDPGNPDTDGDGYLDGVEVISGTDPLDLGSPGSVAAESVSAVLRGGTTWIWYLARVAGILGFIFLWITVFLGLSIRNPILKKIIEPIYSFDFHCFTAALSVFWALIHGTSLLFDPLTQFKFKDITIPFFSKTTIVNVNYLALGIIAFYLMVIMMTTSYLKKHLSHKFWRIFHFLNPIAFIFVVIHGFFIGTDMKNFYVGSAFLFSAFLLILIYFSILVFAVVARFSVSGGVDPANHSDEN